MGKKKQTQHIQQSMGQMVSRAALSQLGPQIENMVRAYVNKLGSQLAEQQASTLETLFARVVVLESIIMEKLGYTTEDLTNKVATIEDEKENLVVSDSGAELNDVVRLEISTKTKDQADFQGSSRIKLYKTGTGQTIGQELEQAIIGMKAGETKEVNFGKDAAMAARIKVDRVSRLVEATSEGAANDDQAQG
jgi:hypothetical protein